MQMTVLIVFAVVLSFGAAGGPRLAQWGWGAIAAAAAMYLGGTAALTWLLTRHGLRRLMGSDESFTVIVRGQHRRMVLLQLWLAVGMIVLVLCGASDLLAATPVVGAVPLGVDIVMAMVFLAGAVLFWRITFRFDQAVRWQLEQDLMLAGLPVRAGWTAGQHLDFNIRHQFLFVAVPVGLIMLASELVDRVAPLVAGGRDIVVATMVAKAVAIGGIFVISPALLVHVWRTRPMPDGELRRRLERLCERIGLRYRQIRIWDTAGVLANAGVMGLHRSVRYVLISDALLEQMDDDQIVAVFGHEAGHVKAHHMGYFLLFMVATMLGCLAVVSAGGVIAERLALPSWWIEAGEQVVMLMLAGLAVGVGFGWLSRRFERQADVYGAWAAGVDAELSGRTPHSGSDLAAGGASFIGALEDIARLNGLPRDGRNWRHGSIRTRVTFLIDWIGRGLSRKDFDRQIAMIKTVAWVGLMIAGVAAALTYRRWM